MIIINNKYETPTCSVAPTLFPWQLAFHPYQEGVLPDYNADSTLSHTLPEGLSLLSTYKQGSHWSGQPHHERLGCGRPRAVRFCWMQCEEHTDLEPPAWVQTQSLARAPQPGCSRAVLELVEVRPTL